MDNNILLISIILLLVIIVGLNVYNTYKTQKIYETIEDYKEPKTSINTSNAYPYYKNSNQHLVSSPSLTSMNKNHTLPSSGMMRRTPQTMGSPPGMMMGGPPPSMMMEGPPPGMMMERPSPSMMMEGPPPGMMMERPSPSMMEGPPPNIRGGPHKIRPPPGILDDEIMVPSPEEMYRRFNN